MPTELVTTSKPISLYGWCVIGIILFHVAVMILHAAIKLLLLISTPSPI